MHVSLSLRGASLLDRALPSLENPASSEIQSETDRLVENAVSMASDAKVMASLFTAGLGGRFVRLGALAAGKPLPSVVLRGASQLLSLAGESGTFALAEGEFVRREGRGTVHPFPKAWAGAAIALGGLRLFNSLTFGANPIVRHLLIDAGLVAGHWAGHTMNLMDKPQGSLVHQMLRAEGLNLSLKASLTLLHGLAPRLSALERSVDLALKTSRTDLFQDRFPPLFSRLAWVEVRQEPVSEKFWEAAQGIEVLEMSGKTRKDQKRFSKPPRGTGKRTSRHPTRRPPADAGGREPIRYSHISFIDPTRVLRIGRASDNDIVISNPEVSEYHAEIDFRDFPNVLVRDLNSAQGTYVRGKKLEAGTEGNLKSRHLHIYAPEVRVGPVRIPVMLSPKMADFSQIILEKSLSSGRERWALKDFSLINPKTGTESKKR